MRKKLISKEAIENAIKERLTKKQFCSIHNIDVATLNSRLKEFNIEYNVGSWKRGKEMMWRQAPHIDKQWLIDNWVNTAKSMRQLAYEQGVTESLLDNRRAKYNLKKTYKYQINTIKLFDKSDNHTCYLAGLIATDGYLEPDNDAISIGLVGEDERALLASILEYYSSTSSVSNYGDYRIRLATDGIKQFFHKEYKIPLLRKTYTLEAPLSFDSEDNAKCYFRGCMDGDGHIGISAEDLSLYTASEAFVEGLIHILSKYNVANLTLLHRKSDGVYYPGFEAGGSTCKRILEWMYSVEDCFKLKRKYERYHKS